MQPVRVYEHPGFERSPRVGIPPEPFRSAEQAWFWTMAALQARQEGGRRPGGSGPPRPCVPDDVVRCLDGLYRCKRIELCHARVLRTWGERGHRPDPHRSVERLEARLWAEAMTLLEWPLRVRGIVVVERYASPPPARDEGVLFSSSSESGFGPQGGPGSATAAGAAGVPYRRIPRPNPFPPGESGKNSELGKKAVDRSGRPILKLTRSTGEVSP